MLMMVNNMISYLEQSRGTTRIRQPPGLIVLCLTAMWGKFQLLWYEGFVGSVYDSHLCAE